MNTIRIKPLVVIFRWFSLPRIHDDFAPVTGCSSMIAFIQSLVSPCKFSWSQLTISFPKIPVPVFAFLFLTSVMALHAFSKRLSPQYVFKLVRTNIIMLKCCAYRWSFQLSIIEWSVAQLLQACASAHKFSSQCQGFLLFSIPQVVY